MTQKIKKVVKKPSKEEIAQLAYYIFIQEGRPHGRDVDHWLQAELLLSSGDAHKKIALR